MKLKRREEIKKVNRKEKEKDVKKRGLVYKITDLEDPAVRVNKLPKEGTWLPLSIAAELAGYSSQMVRYLYRNKIIRAINFSSGPTLVNFEDIGKNWHEN